MAKYNIGGYIFNDENSARKAAKELKTVEYILGQIKEADEQGVLTVYKKLIAQRLFSTEVGISFLNQLRQNLVSSDAFGEEEIPEVYSISDSTVEGSGENSPKVVDSDDTITEEISKDTPSEDKPEKKSFKTKQKKQKADKTNVVEKSIVSGELKRLRLINRFLLVCVFTLLLCVGGMFYVSTTINSPNILNYKEKITDEFASWKEQLDAREKALDEREAKLNQLELNVGN